MVKRIVWIVLLFGKNIPCLLPCYFLWGRGRLLTQWLRLILPKTNVTMKTQPGSSQFCERQLSRCQLPPYKNPADPQAILHQPRDIWASPGALYPFAWADRLELPDSWIYVLSSAKRKKSLANAEREHDISCLAYLADTGFLLNAFLSESLSTCISKWVVGVLTNSCWQIFHLDVAIYSFFLTFLYPLIKNCASVDIKTLYAERYVLARKMQLTSHCLKNKDGRLQW